ncbi:MAG: type II secretion system protein [Proteobacteria bacterium]|nr:type II secretion system protein [Pseudomonadota bacterium]
MRIPRQVNFQSDSREGFTLLEIMVGVGVLGMLLVTMYQLVGTQLMALKNSRDSQLESVAMDGLVRYVQGVLANLPLKTNDVIKGINHVYGMAPADELQWISRPGMALLTSAAPDDEYALTLTIQPTTATSKQQDIGIRRRLSSELDNAYEWIPLLSNVAALEFRYFQPSLGAWMERWEDSTTRPSLVRMKVWRNASEDAFEVVIPVPSARIPQ